MKKIKFTYLIYRNFKGFKHFELKDLSDTEHIYGDNATGKTTLWDGPTWLLFGKDSQNRHDFNIKPLNPDNTPKHKLETEVEGGLLIDDKQITLKRVYKEVWRKKRNAEEAVLDGHTTEYYIDEVPKQKKEYDEFINSICPENLFKLITSPSYFPTKLEWTDQREKLFKIAGELSNEDIAENNTKFQELLNRASGKTFADYKTMINSKKKKFKERLDYIPSRIDEVDRGLPEEKDWNALSEELEAGQKEFVKISAEIEDKSKLSTAEYERRNNLQKELYKEKQKIDSIKHDVSTAKSREQNQHQTKKQEIGSQIDQAKRQISGLKESIEGIQESVESKENRVAKLRGDWHSENDKKLDFDENSSEFVCPACYRKLEDVDVEEKKNELIRLFNENKAEAMKEISAEGKKTAETVTALKKALASKQGELKRFEESLAGAQKQLDNIPSPAEAKQISFEDNPEYQKAIGRIEEINQELGKAVELPDTAVLKERKAELTKSIDSLKGQLNDKETIEKGKKRIEELEAEQKSLAKEISLLEKEEFIMQQFTRAKINALEEKVNSMFSLTKFKLFNIHIEKDEYGNPRTSETCVATNNGVPYPDLNNGMKINVGLDIINTLSKHYGVKAPIWIDNRESLTEMFPIETQAINLYVEEGTDSLARIKQEKAIKEL